MTVVTRSIGLLVFVQSPEFSAGFPATSFAATACLFSSGRYVKPPYVRNREGNHAFPPFKLPISMDARPNGIAETEDRSVMDEGNS